MSVDRNCWRATRYKHRQQLSRGRSTFPDIFLEVRLSEEAALMRRHRGTLQQGRSKGTCAGQNLRLPAQVIFSLSKIKENCLRSTALSDNEPCFPYSLWATLPAASLCMNLVVKTAQRANKVGGKLETTRLCPLIMPAPVNWECWRGKNS